MQFCASRLAITAVLLASTVGAASACPSDAHASNVVEAGTSVSAGDATPPMVAIEREASTIASLYNAADFASPEWMLSLDYDGDSLVFSEDVEEWSPPVVTPWFPIVLDGAPFTFAGLHDDAHLITGSNAATSAEVELALDGLEDR
jgi:hypothetical protein